MGQKLGLEHGNSLLLLYKLSFLPKEREGFSPTSCLPAVSLQRQMVLPEACSQLLSAKMG